MTEDEAAPTRREWAVEERVAVHAPAARVYAVVARVRDMGRWSPECWAVVSRRAMPRTGDRFVGFNRRGMWVWFTSCRVVRAEPDREFAFKVTSFGLPIALWGYRVEPRNEGVELVEYWEDLRRGRGAKAAEFLGRAFTGTPPQERAGVNRVGMRTTLHRVKDAAEQEGGRR
ncbi:SRPBCC family protein [Streptomyces spectabilis]|uniref:SRPBCC family protein n=1 Tax=Streptomyces spectabilis TaxID=68270 RepID=A0A516R1Y8_STRST|nr:SRPBCC family protein [Streptomyces spectabilis]QDQ09672.1 SRPBCC family protein [Streptomyces spectabilis]